MHNMDPIAAVNADRTTVFVDAGSSTQVRRTH